jgi:hypothetical protein
LKKSEPANRMAADFSGGECAIVKVFLMVMWSMGGWTGKNARCPRQHRAYRHQWETNISLLDFVKLTSSNIVDDIS